MSIIVNYMSTISLSGLIDNLASAYRSLARRVFPDVFKQEHFQRWKNFCHHLLGNIFECTSDLPCQPALYMQRPYTGELLEEYLPFDVVDIVFPTRMIVTGAM
jgi:hypothetical protein